MGEFEVIESIIARLSARTRLPEEVLVGPGDDAAVLSVGTKEIVFTTDIAVEGVHFRRDWSSLAQIGAKIAAANCADCEAMGAHPFALVVAVAGPIDEALAVELADGIGAEAARAGAVVVGGDISAGEKLVVSIAALGRLDGRAPVLRSGAQVGDEVVLLGTLGRSAAGWALLAQGRSDVGVDLIETHRRPEVPYGGGAALADAGARAMCDVSDGLLADLGHIAQSSAVAITVWPERIDVSALVAAGSALGVDPLQWALTGGEDHALVATMPRGSILPDGAIVIGEVTSPEEMSAEGRAVTVVGVDTTGWSAGYEHFSG